LFGRSNTRETIKNNSEEYSHEMIKNMGGACSISPQFDSFLHKKTFVDERFFKSHQAVKMKFLKLSVFCFFLLWASKEVSSSPIIPGKK
jgi:hypothetical protein